MIKFNLDKLPGSVRRSGVQYYYNELLTISQNKTNTDLKKIESSLSEEKRKLAVVFVTDKKQKVECEKLGKPYEPKAYLFTSNPIVK